MQTWSGRGRASTSTPVVVEEAKRCKETPLLEFPIQNPPVCTLLPATQSILKPKRWTPIIRKPRKGQLYSPPVFPFFHAQGGVGVGLEEEVDAAGLLLVAVLPGDNGELPIRSSPPGPIYQSRQRWRGVISQSGNPSFLHAEGLKGWEEAGVVLEEEVEVTSLLLVCEGVVIYPLSTLRHLPGQEGRGGFV